MSWVQSCKIQHPDDVREALGFSGEPDGFDLTTLYARARAEGGAFSHGDLRIAWKIANDPYYWAAFKRTPSMDTMAAAGFFDDGQEPGEIKDRMNPLWLTTPLDTVRAYIARLEEEGAIYKKPLVVALTTGCFAPAHDGHLAMMERARDALAANGYEVVGGFLSPSHDDYVSTKGKDEREQTIARQLTAAHRVQILYKMLAESDWLAVDPWESRYAPTDINFTDTVQRLTNYINAHIKSPVPITVAYVFGADNIQFARAFSEKGLCVAVPRPGYEDRLNGVIEKSGLADNPRLIIAQSSGLDIASSQVRTGAAPSARQLDGDKGYEALLRGEARQRYASGDDAVHTYLVRDDLAWGADIWRGRVEAAALDEAITHFRNGLVRAIENAFERTTAPGYPRNVEVVLLPVEEQMREAKRIMQETPESVINNDVITGGAHMAIGLSRLFNLSDAQLRSRTLVPRREGQEIKRVLGRLRAGVYTIVDDDIATGSTIRMIEEMLPQGVTFGERVALSERAFKKLYPDRQYAFWDIVDARDFLMGARSAGLVVRLFNGEHGRAPYILPYASLVSRAKIPPDQEAAFTHEVLKLNARFFRDAWADVRVEDCDAQFQSLMCMAGFRPRTHLSDVCAWHRKMTLG